jgi:peroxiredoxin
MMASIIFGMVLPWLLVCLGCRLIYLLARQNGRVVLRLEAVEEQLGLLRGLLALAMNPEANPPAVGGLPDPEQDQDRGPHSNGDQRSSPWMESGGPRPAPAANGHAPKPVRGKANKGLAASRINRNGLKAGTPAPSFRLPLLDGGELALEEYRGRRLLLIFSDPECDPCQELAPQLEEFHRHSTDTQVLVISRRDPEINRRKVKALGLTFPVVLQRHWQTSLLYGMFATPIAYLIDEQGIIVHDVAVGTEGIQTLMPLARARKEVVPSRA